MTETIIDAKTARRRTKSARKKRHSKKSSNNSEPPFIRLSEVKMQPILQENYEVDWGKAIAIACDKGIGCTQVWAQFVIDDATLGAHISEEMENLGYDFYHHSGPLYRIRWMS